MREILFMGKRIDNGEWVEGDLIQLHDGRKYIVNNRFGACIDDKGAFINTEEPFVCQVDPDTIGQFTGLMDKNGKRIFEGDIVKRCFTLIRGHSKKTREIQVGIVGYSNTECGFVLKNTCNLKKPWDGDTIEVIGNIHDNPELLKE